MSNVCLKSFGLSEEVLQETEVLCLFGISLAQVQEECSEWIRLEGKSLIVFVSESLGWTPVFEKNPQIHLVFCSQDSVDLERFSVLCKEKNFQRFYYYTRDPQLKERVAECQQIQWQSELEASDFRDFGIKVFKNILQNGKRLFDAHSFFSMKNSLKGLPALICGAGPSLKESFSFLKETSNLAVLFAGGAALGKLPSDTIHIAAGIDPDPSWDHFLMQGSFDAPFFYQSRFSSDLLNRIQGPLFQVPSNNQYQLEKWIESLQGLSESSFEGGWTATCFCAALALHLGCNPIVFVGMDLSYSEEGLKYGSGSELEFQEGVFYEGVYTQKDWVIAAKWIESLTEKYPSTSFYTTSQKGLSIKGVQKITESQLLEQELKNSYDIRGTIHAWNKSSWKPEDVSLQKQLIKTLHASFIRSLSLLDEMLGLYQRCYPEDPTEKGEFVVLLFDLYEEVVYQNILEPLWKVWKGPFERKVKGSYGQALNQILFFKTTLQEYLSWEGLCN